MQSARKRQAVCNGRVLSPVPHGDIGGGTRLNESFTFKLQFSHANESGSVDQGQWYGATQLIMEF